MPQSAREREITGGLEWARRQIVQVMHATLDTTLNGLVQLIRVSYRALPSTIRLVLQVLRNQVDFF